MELRVLSPVIVTSFILIHVIVTSALPRQYPRDGDVYSKERKPWALTASDASSQVNCPIRQFYNEVDMACRPCSNCPVNQIIRRPCSARADTLCGPFFEFDTFHQTPVKKVSEEKAKEQGPHHSQNSGPDSETAAAAAGGEEATAQRSSETVSVDQTVQWQWRTLALALITVLAFICCLVVAVGLYVCVMCRRSQNQKHVFREPDLLPPYPDVDPEPRYVETYVTSRDRIRTSRHLPIYQQIFTGSDVSEFPPLTSSACDVNDDVNVPEGDHQSAYINTAIVDIKDS